MHLTRLPSAAAPAAFSPSPPSFDRIGLALSGGGIRAAIFHLGVLKFLAEAQLLEHLRHISTVSGASLAVALIYGKNEYTFPDSETYLKETLPKIRAAILKRDIQERAIMSLTLSPWNWHRKVNLVARAMETLWDIRGRISDLPPLPLWSINCTTFETGKSFRISQQKMGDYKLGYVQRPVISIADAAAASAGFPVLIGPYRLSGKRYQWSKLKVGGQGAKGQRGQGMKDGNGLQGQGQGLLRAEGQKRKGIKGENGLGKSGSEVQNGQWKIGQKDQKGLWLKDRVGLQGQEQGILRTEGQEGLGQKGAGFEKGRQDRKPKALASGSATRKAISHPGTLHLWDGGVYDNQGLEALYKISKGGHLTGDLTYLIASNASASSGFRHRDFFSPAGNLRRLLDITTDQVAALRSRDVTDFFERTGSGCYLKIGSHPNHSSLSPKQITHVKEYPTTLASPSPSDFDLILLHGYEVARANLSSTLVSGGMFMV